MTDENSDRLWTVRNLFEILNEAFSKFYSPSEHLAVDEVIILFKRRVIFRHYIPKKHKRFGIKIYKLCDETRYTYMTVYSLLDRGRGGGGNFIRRFSIHPCKWYTGNDGANRYTGKTLNKEWSVSDPDGDAATISRVTLEWWEWMSF